MRSLGHCKTISVGMSLGLLGTLVACGGGSVPASTPAPVISQTPAPTPPVPVPAPPPAGPSSIVSVTQEAADTTGIMAVGAQTAYDQGITGKGVTLAVLDTGLNTNNASKSSDVNFNQLAGRIDPGSKDFTTGGAIIDSYLETDGKTYPYGHGTAVADVIAAAKDGIGIYGVAYEATIFAARIYGGEPPSNGTETQAQLLQDNVNFNNHFADAIIAACAANARAVNLSLGYTTSSNSPVPSDPNNTPPDYTAYNASAVRFNAEIQNTFDKGVIIVNAAGNDHKYTGTGANRKEVTDSTGAVIGASPNQFPQDLVNNFSKNGSATIRDIPLLIVGAVDANNVITDYSNRAGTGIYANYYLVAPGNVVTPFDNGALYNVEGTSFSAPIVTGAIGLLAQKFPMLTGQNITDLLLSTATHLGTTPAGTLDPVYGHGLLNITAAFQPQGAASVQTASGIVTLAINALPNGLTSQLSSAFGDGAALRTALKATVYLDAYKRPYITNLAGPLANANRTIGLAGFANTTTRQISSVSSAKNFSFNFSAERNDSLPGYYDGLFTSSKPLGNVQFDAHYAFSKTLSLSFASGTGDSRVLGLSTDSSRDLLNGYDDRLMNIVNASQKFGFGVNARLGNFELLSGFSHARDNGQIQNTITQSPITIDKVAMHIRRQWSNTLLETGITLQTERGSVLGSRAVNGFGLGTGTQGFIGRLSGTYTTGPWTVAATGHFGRIAINGAADGIVNKTDALLVSAFAASARYALPGQSGNVVFGISQPLRVESGSAHVSVPSGYDYASFQVVSTPSTVSLAPTGREMDMEFGYSKQVSGYGALQMNIFDRFNPGNNAFVRNDKGLLLRWKSDF